MLFMISVQFVCVGKRDDFLKQLNCINHNNVELLTKPKEKLQRVDDLKQQTVAITVLYLFYIIKL